MRIGDDLIKAYQGYYENQHSPDGRSWFHGEPTREEAIEMIKAQSPKERLEVYLHWNGIIGWTNRIWEISQGEM